MSSAKPGGTPAKRPEPCRDTQPIWIGAVQKVSHPGTVAASKPAVRQVSKRAKTQPLPTIAGDAAALAVRPRASGITSLPSMAQRTAPRGPVASRPAAAPVAVTPKYAMPPRSPAPATRLAEGSGPRSLSSLAGAPLPRLSDRFAAPTPGPAARPSGTATERALPNRRFALAEGTRSPVARTARPTPAPIATRAPAAPAPIAARATPIATRATPIATRATPTAERPAPIAARPAPAARPAIARAPRPQIMVVPDPAQAAEEERAAQHAKWLAEAAIANAAEDESIPELQPDLLDEIEPTPRPVFLAPPPGFVAPTPTLLVAEAALHAPPAPAPSFAPAAPTVIVAEAALAPSPVAPRPQPQPHLQHRPVQHRAPSTPWSPTDEAFFSAGEELERGDGLPDTFDDLDALALADGDMSLSSGFLGLGKRRR